MTSKPLLALAGVALVCGSALGHFTGEPAESADTVQPLLIGARIPELTLRGADGRDFDLNAAVAKKPTILIFYRGGW